MHSSFVLNETNSSGTQKQEKNQLPKTLEKALEYIDSRFNEVLSLADVASICAVSETHLSHLFSEHLNTGFSPASGIQTQKAS